MGLPDLSPKVQSETIAARPNVSYQQLPNEIKKKHNIPLIFFLPLIFPFLLFFFFFFCLFVSVYLFIFFGLGKKPISVNWDYNRVRERLIVKGEQNMSYVHGYIVCVFFYY